jgi:hypothetical protein
MVTLSACGGASKHTPPSPPKLPHALGQRLAREAEGVAAASDPCRALETAKQLQIEIEYAIRDIPAGLRQPLSESAKRLVLRIQPQCVPSTKPAEEDHPAKGHGHGRGHEKHKQHGGEGKGD